MTHLLVDRIKMSFNIESLLAGHQSTNKTSTKHRHYQSEELFSPSFTPAKCFSWKHFEELSNDGMKTSSNWGKRNFEEIEEEEDVDEVLHKRNGKGKRKLNLNWRKSGNSQGNSF